MENFDGLLEAMGGTSAEAMDFEYADADKLEDMVENCTTGLFLVLMGDGGDFELSKRANKLVISEPRTDEEDYEYIHSFVVIKTEEEGVKVFQQNPVGMDDDKEVFAADEEFWADLKHLTAHSRAGVVPKTFQRLFCGSTEPKALPSGDRMMVKALAY